MIKGSKCRSNKLRGLFALLMFASVYVQGFGQTSTSIRLTDNWEFLQSDVGGIWEAVRPSGKLEGKHKGKPQDVPRWTHVTLPHCYNATDAVNPDVNYYQGPGWYRTAIVVNNPFKNGRTLLHFEGAGQKTRVYVGMELAGSHVGGYDEFTIDITDAIEAYWHDENLSNLYKEKVPISIRCDNTRDLEMIPSDLSDFNLYGGLYRYVNLKYEPEISFENLKILAEVDEHSKEGSIKMSASFYNKSDLDEVNLEVKLLSPQGELVLQQSQTVHPFVGEKQLWQTEIEKPVLWSMNSPNLYTCQVSLTSPYGTATRTEQIGFRHFEFEKHGPFMLNGERVLLRGTHRHEDHAGVAAAMTEDMIREEMLLMKDMGVNFLRLGHYQQSSIVLDLCDSLGIVVWEEIPWCRGGVGGSVYREQGRRMLKNMIDQHYNHPSVIIWGLGNENDWPGDAPVFEIEAVKEYMTKLNTYAHQLDPSRKTAIRRCTACKDIVDVYSPSIWAGWYRGKYTDYKKSTWDEVNNVDYFLHVEWGASHHARRHSEDPDRNLDKIAGGEGTDERDGDASLYGGPPRVSKDGDWSETYACNLIDWHLKEQEEMPWLTGTAYWPFKDFSTPVRPENPVPYVNQKGVVERDFTKKESFYVFQSYWTEKPMIHIYGHTWPTRWGKEGEEKMVKVYSNCEEVELIVNGVSLGIKERNSQDFPAGGLRWKVAFKAGENTVQAIGKKGKIKITDTIQVEYETRQWMQPEALHFSSYPCEKEDDITWVEVTLKDTNGVTCLDAKNVVHFSVNGDGKLVENLGTSIGASKVQVYNGRAKIRVQMNGAKNVVSVKSEGLQTQFITLEPKK